MGDPPTKNLLSLLMDIPRRSRFTNFSAQVNVLPSSGTGDFAGHAIGTILVFQDFSPEAIWMLVKSPCQAFQHGGITDEGILDAQTPTRFSVGQGLSIDEMHFFYQGWCPK